MFKRILLPLDGSDTSESILDWVMPLAVKLKSEIVLTTVIELDRAPEFGLRPGGFRASAVPPEVIVAREEQRETHERARNAATRYLESLERRFRNESVEITVHVVSGDPDVQIVAEAIAREVDLVAMATHRASQVTRGVLGSVADRVLRTSPLPVLLLRPSKSDGDVARSATIDSIVVPLDLSEKSESAIESAISLADATNARLRLVTVTAGVYIERPSLGAWHGRFYTGGQLRSEAREYLDNFVDGAESAGVEAEAIAVSGDPAQEIIRVVRDDPGSMVIMASSGLSRFRRWMIGSTTDKVVRGAECPVLVLPYVAVPPSVESNGEEVYVGDVMTSPAITTTGDATLGQAARTMVDNHIGCLPVVDAEGGIIGMITESLFVPTQRYMPFSRDPIYTVFDQSIGGADGIPDALYSQRDRPIREIMMQRRAMVTEDVPLTEAARLMMRDSVSHLPVHVDGKIIGVVALHDLLNLVADSENHQPESREIVQG